MVGRKKEQRKDNQNGEKKKVQVSVDKKREQQIEKETKKGREEREKAFHLFCWERGSARTALHVVDFVSLPLRHITIECRSTIKHCHIKQERRKKKESQKYVVGR